MVEVSIKIKEKDYSLLFSRAKENDFEGVEDYLKDVISQIVKKLDDLSEGHSKVERSSSVQENEKRVRERRSYKNTFGK